MEAIITLKTLNSAGAWPNWLINLAVFIANSSPGIFQCDLAHTPAPQNELDASGRTETAG